VNRKEWQAIEQAGELLRLGDRATLAEIKRAYHHLSKLHHPDTAGTATGSGSSEQMYRITAAYELLMRYCSEYRFPLKRDEIASEGLDPYDPEEWWQARFGQDPLWGGKKTRQR
jgi:hypothetical protein